MATPLELAAPAWAQSIGLRAPRDLNSFAAPDSPVAVPCNKLPEEAWSA